MIPASKSDLDITFAEVLERYRLQPWPKYVDPYDALLRPDRRPLHEQGPHKRWNGEWIDDADEVGQ